MQLDYPSPETYEKEYIYWPWGRLIESAIKLAVKLAPPNGCVLDYMCGTGYLLGQLANKRQDLNLVGCSLGRADYITYGIDKYPRVRLFHADALTFAPLEAADVVICTGGIHHLRSEDRDPFLSKITSEIRPGGWLIIGEEVLSPHTDELMRRAAVAELHSDLLRYSITSKAPAEILQVSLDLFRADLFELGEYKLTEANLRTLIQSHISIAALERVWPSDPVSLYGDRLFLCGPKGSRSQLDEVEQ